MNLLIQPSFTETFNMVTADGASESVPSVVTDAIRLDSFRLERSAEGDDVTSIARVAPDIFSLMPMPVPMGLRFLAGA